MKQLATHANRFTDYLVAVVITLEPFYAFLTVWGSSLIGHYTVLRLWDDVLLLVLFGVACWWLAAMQRYVAGLCIVCSFDLFLPTHW